MSYININHSIGDQLKESKRELSVDIFNELHLHYPDTYPVEHREDLLSYLEQLVELTGQSLLKNFENETEVYSWGKEVGNLATSHGTPLATTISKVTLYKKAILNGIIHWNDTLTPERLLEVYIEIDHVFNTMISAFSEAYSDYSQRQLKASEEKYLSLSTPVVPIFDHLAILPLIGNVDEVRADMMIEHVLLECKNLSIHQLIIDLSGVYEVNPLFQEGIMKLIDSLKLLGIEPTLTGMRPEMSLKFIEVGINLSTINIFQSLSKAVEHHQLSLSK
ncbi:STAS domain-containing protein [Rossellomorea oryzaecorticis]|uniref:STAS domain-containing protein n=1 Tax=Rossellomorea oryzaecorticis TaxID=1396505 RepID=A0ABU9K6R6_9BACI